MTRPLRIGLAAAACLGFAVFIARPQSSDDPLDPLKVCKETQKLIFENQLVRVIDDQIPPGGFEPLHHHRHGVQVYINNYTNEQTPREGKPVVSDRKSGTASWSEDTVHTVKNIGSTPSHAIRIELKY
jgi:hypothetical protein